MAGPKRFEREMRNLHGDDVEIIEMVKVTYEPQAELLDWPLWLRVQVAALGGFILIAYGLASVALLIGATGCLVLLFTT